MHYNPEHEAAIMLLITLAMLGAFVWELFRRGNKK